MPEKYTFEKLLFMSDESVRKFLGHLIVCTMKLGLELTGTVENFEVAANEPHHLCGFIIDSGKHIGFGSIESLTIEI